MAKQLTQTKFRREAAIVKRVRTRASASLVLVTALAGSTALTVAAPMAHADDEVNAVVTRDRHNAGPACEPLKYNQLLADIAIDTANWIPNPSDAAQKTAQYSGDLRVFVGTGDPQAAAITDAYKNGAGPLVSDCSWTEYGTSFFRAEGIERDWVGIVFGRPAAVPQPSGPGTQQGQQPPPSPPPPVKCPQGSPQSEVPAGETCPAPTNAIRVSFSPGYPNWTVTVTNSAGIGGSCTYTATPNNGTAGFSHTFPIGPAGPDGSANFTVPAPLPLTSYHVVTKCTGTYDGHQVEFGHDEQDKP